jgi:NTE family protein
MSAAEFATMNEVIPESKFQACASSVHDAGQLVLVLQGGGALGAYQAGVYHALHDAGLEPDWVIGTSIGAINASLICGNDRGRRLTALHEFWHRVSLKGHLPIWPIYPPFSQIMNYWSILGSGLQSFFDPNPLAFCGPHVDLGPDRAGYYSTEPLRRTLWDLVDFDLINRGAMRLTVGAAHVRSSQMRYFDTKAAVLDVRHIMASGALPPAFPAVRIDGELYWDGGILSNTPAEIIFDEYPRHSSLIFAVHMWNPVGHEPRTIWDVMHRHKDIQYSSRIASHITRQKQLHRLRHIIEELAAHIPAEARESKRIEDLLAQGCDTRMHVVRLLAPSLEHEDQTKDVDFSKAGIRARWRAGYDNAQRTIQAAPWKGEFDPMEGVLLHEFVDTERLPTGPRLETA